MAKPPIIDRSVPIEDREQFIRDNAVALVRQLEGRLVGQQKHMQKIERQVRDYRTFQKQTGAEAGHLRRKLKAIRRLCAEVVAEAERYSTVPGDLVKKLKEFVAEGD